MANDDFINLVADKIRQSRGASALGRQAADLPAVGVGPGAETTLGGQAATILPPGMGASLGEQAATILPPGPPTTLGGQAALPEAPPPSLDPEQVNAALRYLSARQNGQLQ